MRAATVPACPNSTEHLFPSGTRPLPSAPWGLPGPGAQTAAGLPPLPCPPRRASEPFSAPEGLPRHLVREPKQGVYVWKVLLPGLEEARWALGFLLSQ